MPESPLLASGAQIEPTAAAPLHTNEFFSGMVTQANPLGPGLVPTFTRSSTRPAAMTG